MSDAVDRPLEPYDGILLLSFGGPEKPEDVLPFLRTVTAGRGIPDARLEEVGQHYYGFGGRSPINDQNRALLAALRAELDRRGIDTPLVWGNRNFAPFTVEALTEAAERGMTRLVTVVTSAYSSYSSCRQYREDLALAQREAAEAGHEVAIDKVRPYANHPGFSRANARLVTEAVRGLLHDGVDPAGIRLVFVTHSIPTAMDDTSGPGDELGNAYARQHIALGAAITGEVNATLDTDLEGELAFCSRSGPTSQPWLEPD
ncbi:MAG: ferrochelatase, partial [Actinomycetes bacterium]